VRTTTRPTSVKIRATDPRGAAKLARSVGSALLAAWLTTGATATEPPVFEDVATEAGLTFQHFNGMTGRRYFAEMMGAGGALFDFDGDGDLDIYLVQGRLLDPDASMTDALIRPQHDPPDVDRLYRNDSPRDLDGRVTALRFTDITQAAGLAPGQGYGMGVTAGDFDGDGWTDLYVTAMGANRLLRNSGTGRLIDVTESAGVDDRRWSVSAAFTDIDRDGDLDLFVGNYVDFRIDNNRDCRSSTGMGTYCSPLMYRPAGDSLFINLGDGRFEDRSEAAGVSQPRGGALGVLPADLDGDDWPDLYVANDGTPNIMWVNRHDGSFSDEALLAGTALDRDGAPEASMGIDAGDFDNDGDLDLFMTHLTGQTNTLYVNDGDGWFADRTARLGLGDPSFSYTGFGAAWLDYDNDGLLDLLTVNGEVVVPPDRRTDDPLPLQQTDQLFRNSGGRFEERTQSAGASLANSGVSRGLAIGDIDDDGDVDILISDNGGPVRLLVNRVGQDAHWLGLDLRDDHGGVALGARVRLLLDQDALGSLRYVHVAGSYASSSDPRIVYGLADDGEPVDVRVDWPDGNSELFEDLEADRYHRLRQGSSGRTR
jgi:enediyne biosynthesis protein E4